MNQHFPWEGLISIAVMLAAFKLLPFGRSGTWPYENIGSGAFVHVINETDTTQTITFSAPKFSPILRSKEVPAHTETYMKSPYTDTEVHVIRGADTTVLHIFKPGIYEIKP